MSTTDAWHADKLQGLFEFLLLWVLGLQLDDKIQTIDDVVLKLALKVAYRTYHGLWASNQCCLSPEPGHCCSLFERDCVA